MLMMLKYGLHDERKPVSSSTYFVHALLSCAVLLIPILPAAAEPDGNAGRIRGRVRVAATGEAVAGALVTLFGSGGSFETSTTSDAGGRFELITPGPGTYFVTASAGLLQPEVWNGIDCSDCVPTTGTPIAVPSGGIIPGIDFNLEARGTLSGTITAAATGDPVPFAEVSVIALPNTVVSSVVADANGHYQSGPLAAGTYAVVARPFPFNWEVFDDRPCVNFFCFFEEGDPVTVAPAMDTPGIDFALSLPGTLSGTVTEMGSGVPIANTRVKLWRSAGDFVGDFNTGPTGAFEFSLPAGDYFLTAESFFHLSELYADLPCPGGPPAGCNPLDGTPISVTSGGTTSGIHFQLEALGKIRGRVTDAITGAGIAGGFLPNAVFAFDAAGMHVGTASPDVDGSYTLQGLPAGNYFVVTRTLSHRDELWNGIPCPGGPPSGCTVTSGTAIAVALQGVVTSIDFALDPLGAIEGQLTDGFTGEPVAGAEVSIFKADGQLLGSVPANGLGRYSSGPLLPGSYFVGVDAQFGRLAELYADVPCPDGLPACNPTTGTPVPVALAGATSGIDFDLALGPGIQGTVVAHGGHAPLPGVAIDFFSSDGFLAGSTATLANGRYQLSLPSGTYHVATDNGFGGLDAVFRDRPCPDGPAFLGLCDPALGEPVTVASSGPATSGINFVLSVAPIFGDGFESGDTSAWTLVVP